MEDVVASLFGSAASATAARAGNSPRLLLAPMVRAGHLPLRLWALHLGAHAVFSEELICKKLVRTERVVNYDLGTVDFCTVPQHQSGQVNNHDRVVFRTNAYERDRVILQIGAADALEAVAAASIVAGDVAAIDLNMGCPQHFSISGGMGAALLKKPDTAVDIVQSLRRSLPSHVPVSCKIRLLGTERETITLMQQLEQAGASAITVHARRVPERPRDPARWDEVKNLVDCVNIPVLANGDVWGKADAAKFLDTSGASGVLIARGAIGDPSLAFSSSPYPSLSEQIMDYMALGSLCGANVHQDKWLISQIIRYRRDLPSDHKRNSSLLSQAKTREDLCKLFDVEVPLSRDILWQGIDRGNPHELPSAEAWANVVKKACVGVSAISLVDKGTKRARQDDLLM